MAVDVSIVPCKSYDAEECRTALTQALAPFGGLDWVKEGMHIVIKVNLVSAMKPEQAATTHPMLLCELTKMLQRTRRKRPSRRQPRRTLYGRAPEPRI